MEQETPTLLRSQPDPYKDSQHWTERFHRPYNADMNARPFIKMHGLGNDFVVLDGRTTRITVDARLVQAIANRRTGIGCDQVIILEPSDQADLFMRIYNSDGSEVEACGNAARCVAQLIRQETGAENILLETTVNILRASVITNELIAIDMGRPRLSWHEIPLSRQQDTLHIPLEEGSLSDPTAVNLGNPHATFFVDDVSAVPLEDLGPKLEINPIFPKHANIGVAQIISRGKIRLRVWERGAGLTLACGTGACAALVAAHRRQLCSRNVEVQLDGGTLKIRWQDDDHVIMTGTASTAFAGEIDLALLP